MKRILLVHLVSNGDCLYSTAIARQLKTDYPDCKLTWAISYKCSHILHNNPYVDDVWEINYQPADSPVGNIWQDVKRQAELRKKNNEFDAVYYLQMFPDNLKYFDGTIRSSLFNAFGRIPEISVHPVIRLTENEINNTKKFAEYHNFSSYKNIVLCECAPSSGQSFLNPELMLQIAEEIVELDKTILFIISSHLKIQTNSSRIIDASSLSFRENAELSKYCTLLIGCSSGLTWLLTSDWSKKIPTVQFLKKKMSRNQFFASVKYDLEYWGESTNDIIESSNNDKSVMSGIILSALEDFQKAKSKFDEKLIPSVDQLFYILFHRDFPVSYKDKISSIKLFLKRNPDYKYSNIAFVFLRNAIAEVVLNVNQLVQKVFRKGKRMAVSFIKSKKK